MNFSRIMLMLPTLIMVFTVVSTNANANAECEKQEAQFDIAGYTFVGPPNKEKNPELSSRGEFSFDKKGNCNYHFPGSDIRQRGKFVQKNKTITVGKITLTLSKDNKTLTDSRYKIKFVRKK